MLEVRKRLCIVTADQNNTEPHNAMTTTNHPVYDKARQALPFAPNWIDCPENRKLLEEKTIEFQQKTLPALEKAGITVIGFLIDQNPAYYATLEYRGEKFQLLAPDIFNTKAMCGFTRIIERVHTVAKQIAETQTDPFYCNIYNAVRSEIGDDVQGKTIAHSYATSFIHNRGIKIWS